MSTLRKRVDSVCKSARSVLGAAPQMLILDEIDGGTGGDEVPDPDELPDLPAWQALEAPHDALTSCKNIPKRTRDQQHL